MTRTALTALFLFALWLLLSGVYNGLVVGLGAASAVFAVFVVRRMDDKADADRLAVRVRPLELVRYLVWLLIEIFKANWAVTKTIMTPEMPIRQHFFPVPYSQATDLGQTIFANSITLTPGTITVEIEDDHFWVHAVSYSDSDIGALTDMDARVSRTEATG
jgi:multicomponent Na+:H+ antiporter subunit E